MTIIPRNGGGGNVLGLPLGGADGQILAKASAADGDVEWIDNVVPTPPSAPSDGGTLGYDPVTGVYVPYSQFGVAAGAVARYVADRGTSTTTPGAEVTQWDDQITPVGGFGNLTRIAAGTGPTYEIGDEDGVPLLRFRAASNAFLRKLAVTSPGDHDLTVLCVCRLLVPANDSRVWGLIANGQTTTNERCAGLRARLDTDGVYLGYDGKSLGGAHVSVRPQKIGSAGNGGNATANNDSRLVWCVSYVVYQRVAFPTALDLAYLAENEFTGRVVSGQTANPFEYIGLGVGGQLDVGADTMNNPCDVEIRELTIWQRALTAQEITIDRRRAAQTWAVPLIS